MTSLYANTIVWTPGTNLTVPQNFKPKQNKSVYESYTDNNPYHILHANLVVPVPANNGGQPCFITYFCILDKASGKSTPAELFNFTLEEFLNLPYYYDYILNVLLKRDLSKIQDFKPSNLSSNANQTPAAPPIPETPAT